MREDWSRDERSMFQPLGERRSRFQSNRVSEMSLREKLLRDVLDWVRRIYNEDGVPASLGRPDTQVMFQLNINFCRVLFSAVTNRRLNCENQDPTRFTAFLSIAPKFWFDLCKWQ